MRGLLCSDGSKAHSLCQPHKGGQALRLSPHVARTARTHRTRSRTTSAAAPEAAGLVSFDADSQDSTGFATAHPNARPIVLLPGFGNNLADYTAPFGSPSEGLATQLRERGWHVEVLPLERKAWFNVARSLLTLGVWRGTLTTHPGYTWYLEHVARAVLAAQEATGSNQVHLLGHSAGGWLGRAFIGRARGSGAERDGAEGAQGPHPAVASLVTLGTPHRPPSTPDAASGGGGGAPVRDMTGGALGWVDSSWPGAAFGGDGLSYVAVAGRAVRGCPVEAKQKTRTIRGYAHAAYTQVSGDGDVWGDCVVPTAAAVLEGATNVVLDGVRHSMARIGSFDERAADDHVWYGSEQVLDLWLHHLAALDAPNTARGAAAAAPGIVLPAAAPGDGDAAV